MSRAGRPDRHLLHSAQVAIRHGKSADGGPWMTPPTWLDAHGRRRPTLACWTCGREVAPMRRIH